MSENSSGPTARPWWVRLAIPAAEAKRRHVLRNAIVLTVLTAIWGAVMIALAFMDGSNLHPYRWWVVGFFTTAAVAFVAEFLAIRWTDQAGLWQR